MRSPRSVQLLTVFATLATLAACGTMGRRGVDNQPRADYSSTVVVWDSRPLDQDYQRQRTDMDARHAQEVSAPRDNESGDRMRERQTSESKDLDNRYAQGKASHAKSVPAGDERRDDNSRQ